MVRAGVKLLAGTDVPVFVTLPGFDLHRELGLMVEAGLSPAVALRTATLEPARYLGATDSLGTVAAGKLADLVLLDANPLADIHNTTKIRGVVANGRFFDRAALDALLKEVERVAAAERKASAQRARYPNRFRHSEFDQTLTRQRNLRA
jgi:adenine deaminase